MSVVKPRSFCPNCKTTLRWYELIPVISFLFLRGKCRSCGAKISIRYPIIEILCGIVFVLLFSMDDMTIDFVAHSCFFALLLMIFVIDWENLTIPNGIIIGGLIIGIMINLSISLHPLIEAVGSALLAAIVMFAIRWIGNAVFKKETMGMGDVKLAALVGLFLGVQNFLFAVWAAAVIGCVYWTIKRFSFDSPKDAKLPFGSFLSLASFLVLMMSNQLSRLF